MNLTTIWKRLFHWAGLLCLLAKLPSASAADPHYVFAHYMVCFATYGATVAGYEQDIKDAQAAGVDGFVLDVPEWNGPDTYYNTRTEQIFQAAEALGTHFKLLFSVEMTNTADIVAMLGTYTARSNYFYFHNKAVVSTYGQNSVDWANGVFAPLSKQGINVFFVPYFEPEPISHAQDYSNATNLLTKYTNILDGLYYFAAGTVSNMIGINDSYNQACKQYGKIFMAGYSPSYWGCNQPPTRGYIEDDGGEGTVSQWTNIIQTQPDWVEITTWNDWGESTYISPIADPSVYFPDVASPRRYSHGGFLELSRRYIAWYKTGQPPANNADALFYFYRTHSTNAVASSPTELPVTNFKGDVADIIYTTVILTAPATLQISSGPKMFTNSLPAGMTHVRVPFAPGAQKFSVTRNGTQVLSAQGPDILSAIQVYDYFPASGYTYGLPAPSNLRIVH
ncbi:MAG TPA: endo-1,3-alpha-glucanase family glycosylhydrolase [Verrucomicrobiae bacterium]|nr:endo-1,3-alpha-glucanase family glycosylhydrolase [Verrucomicrobiae bacterium]